MTSSSQSGNRPKGFERRQFLKLSGGSALAAVAAGTAVVSASGPAAAAISGRTNKPADLPAASGPRCVVVGGGASGLTLAKYLKKENPKFDVVMVEPNYLYMSPFLSNLFIDDVLDASFLRRQFDHIFHSRPSDSSQPHITFMFCTAWPCRALQQIVQVSRHHHQLAGRPLASFEAQVPM